MDVQGALLRDRDDFERQFAFARREVLSDLLAMKSDATTLGALIAGAVREGLEPDYVSELAQTVAALDVEAVGAQLDWVLFRGNSVTLLAGPPKGIADARRGHGLTGRRSSAGGRNAVAGRSTGVFLP